MKFSIVTISFFVMMLLLTHTWLVLGQCPQPVPQQYAYVKPGNVVAAYFASWDKYGLYQVADIEPIAHKLTHVIYAFAKPNAQDARCDLHDPWADVGANFQHRKKVGGHFGQLLQLKKKHPHLKVLLSVGGGTYSKQLIEIAQQGNIEKFVDSVVDLLDFYEYEYEHSLHGSDHVHTFEYPDLFDGVDLDWEWQSANVLNEQVAMYHSMVRSLSNAMRKRSKQKGRTSILTCAVQVRPALLASLRLSDLEKSVDWFHVMTYDFGGATAPGVSFNAPICNQWSDYSIDSSIQSLMLSGVSPSKLVLGIPLYGHVYDQTKEKLGSSFAKTEKTGAFRYEQIKEMYLDNPDCYKKWHSKSHVPYAYCPYDGVFVSYDDERSIAVKIAYAREKLLKGIFFWRLSGDDKDHSLLKSIRI